MLLQNLALEMSILAAPLFVYYTYVKLGFVARSERFISFLWTIDSQLPQFDPMNRAIVNDNVAQA